MQLVCPQLCWLLCVCIRAHKPTLPEWKGKQLRASQLCGKGSFSPAYTRKSLEGLHCNVATCPACTICHGQRQVMERMAALVSEVGGRWSSPQKQGSLDVSAGGIVSLVLPQPRVPFNLVLTCCWCAVERGFVLFFIPCTLPGLTHFPVWEMSSDVLLDFSSLWKVSAAAFR